MANRRDNPRSERRDCPRAIALVLLFALLTAGGCGGSSSGPASQNSTAASGLDKVQHIIVLMQENHSFDNYFGVLPYVPGGPYHAPASSGSPCKASDHTCVNGLSCTVSGANLDCSNSNVAADGSTVHSYHDYNYCVEPDLDHTWHGSHRELNTSDPNKTMSSTSDGFVRENEKEEQNEDDTMGYYNEEDLPYYYKLAETFAVSDSNFCDLIGPTSPNRFYSLAATSFGHVVTPGNKSGGDTPPAQGFQPIYGTIFDRLDAFSIKWSEYYDPPSSESALYPDVISETMPSRPYGHVFRPSSPNYLLMSQFYTDAAAGNLAQVVWIDLQYDEHPPADIRSGQQEVAQIITAIRNSPAWSTSIVFFTYDEHGGAYDHVSPPAATPPDSIPPGLCADNSNPPGSTHPGGGIDCTESFTDAQLNCPSMTSTTFPADCAQFKQLGIRVPFVAISPFAKPSYVSHVVSDHTSILALIEKRFMSGVSLTARDAAASTLEDLFDFKHSPSANASVPASLAEPSAPDHNCP